MHRYTHRLKFEKKNCCFGSRLTRLTNANASKANQIDAAVGDDVVGATPCEKVYYIIVRAGNNYGMCAITTVCVQ